jgi:glycerophosphoryl diester phosphodiesterase
MNSFIIPSDKSPLVIAHRGGGQLWPENTMLAYQSAIDMGVDGLEIDIRMTKDQMLVTHHNESIDQTSNGQGKIRDYTYEELKEYNFGYQFEDLYGNHPYRNMYIPLPTLEEVLQKFEHKILILELKDSESWGMRAAEKLAELLKHYSPNSHMVVASFKGEVMDHFARITDHKVLLSAPEKEAAKFILSSKTIGAKLYQPKVQLLHLPTSFQGLNLATPEIIKDAHQQDIAIHFWTINKPEEMEQLIRNGADGLVTDRPDLLLEILAENGFQRKAV